jgi:hypothetical protein
MGLYDEIIDQIEEEGIDTGESTSGSDSGSTADYNDTYVPTEEDITADVEAASGGDSSGSGGGSSTADYNDTYVPTEEDIREDVATASAPSTQGIETGGGSGMASVTLTNDAGQDFTYRGSASEVADRAEKQFLKDNPEYTAKDVGVYQGDDGLRFEFTSSGEAKRRRKRRESAKSKLAQQFEEEYGAVVDLDDIILEDVGGGKFKGTLTDEAITDLGVGASSGSGRPKPTQASINRRIPGAPSRDTMIETKLEQQIQEQTGTAVDLEREDFTISEAGKVTLTQSGRRKAADDDSFEYSANVDLGGLPGVDEGTTLLDVKEKLGEVTKQVQEVNLAGAEDLRAITNPGGFVIDTYRSGGAPDYEIDDDGPAQEQLEGVVEGIGGITTTAPLSLGISGIEGYEFAAETTDRAGNEGISSTVTIEESETGAPVLEWGDTGAIGFAAKETGEAATQAVEGIEEELSTPRGRARLAGSLIGSAAVMGGAAALSPRLGLASRVAIQPGEELLGYGGNAVTRRVAGARTAERLFPNNEPLIFSEEAAIRGLRRAGGRASNLPKYLRGDAELPPSPYQSELIERFRPGGGVGEFSSEFGTRADLETDYAEYVTAGAKSEPLGSDTSSILDATTAIEGDLDRPLPLDVTKSGLEFGGEGMDTVGVTPEMQSIARKAGVEQSRRAMAKSIARSLKKGEVPEGLEIEVGTRMGAGLGGLDLKLKYEPELEEPSTPDYFDDFSQFDTNDPLDFMEQRRQAFGDYEGEQSPFGRDRAARRPFYETESDRDAAELERSGRRLESAFDVKTGALSVDGFRPGEFVRSDVVETPVQIPELRVDLDTETDTELDFETELETEFGTPTDFLTDLEIETEFERESEGEYELEFEPYGKKKKKPDPLDAFPTGDEFDKTFTSKVATPDYVLSGSDPIDQ